jgi:hypothetical protein
MREILGLQLAPTTLLLDTYLGDDTEYVERVIEDKYDMDADDADIHDFIKALDTRRGFLGWVYDEEGKLRLLMWIRDEEDLVTLSHEVIHATWYMEHFAGFNFSYESQEIQTYLFEYIMTNILKRLSDE